MTNELRAAAERLRATQWIDADKITERQISDCHELAMAFLASPKECAECHRLNGLISEYSTLLVAIDDWYFGRITGNELEVVVRDYHLDQQMIQVAAAPQERE